MRRREFISCSAARAKVRAENRFRDAVKGGMSLTEDPMPSSRCYRRYRGWMNVPPWSGKTVKVSSRRISVINDAQRVLSLASRSDVSPN
jgi:hypothetical protein